MSTSSRASSSTPCHTPPPRRSTGRPRHAEIFFGQALPTQRPDISHYPSKDSRRITTIVPSPKKKRRTVGPEDLNDELAHWVPAGAVDNDDDFDVSNDAGDIPVANTQGLGKRKRHASSVRFSLSFRSFYFTMLLTALII